MIVPSCFVFVCKIIAVDNSLLSQEKILCRSRKYTATIVLHSVFQGSYTGKINHFCSIWPIRKQCYLSLAISKGVLSVLWTKPL